MAALVSSLGAHAAPCLRHLGELLPQLVFITDAAGNCVYANRRWQSRTGLDERQTAHDGWLEAIHEADREASREAWLTTRIDGRIFEREVRLSGTEAPARVQLRIEPVVDRERVAWIASATPMDGTREHEELERSEERCRLAMAAGNLGIWEWNVADDQIYWSPECARIVGVRDFEGSLAAFQRLVHPEDLGELWARVDVALAGGTPFSCEFRLVRPDGEVRWVRNEGTVVRGEDGTPTRLVGSVQDVTERVVTERRQASRAEKLRAVLETVPTGIAIFDGSMVLRAASARYLAMLGLSPEAVGSSLYALAPDVPESWRRAHARCLDGETLSGEDTWARADGSNRRYAWELRPWRSQAGEVLGILLKTDDVTERHSADAAIREREARLRRVLAATPFPLAIHDETGEVIFTNQAWNDGAGYGPDVVRTTGDWLRLAFGEERSSEIDEIIRGLYRLDTVSDGTEIQITTRAGDKRTWVCRSAPLGVDDRGRQQVITMADDVTERRRMELEARTARERLNAALAASGTGTFRWEVRDGGLSWDDNLKRLFGLPLDHRIERLDDFLARVHPEDRPGVVDLCAACARTGGSFAMEFRMILPDGTVRWLDDRGTMHLDELGRPSYMTGACSDVTERKAAQEALAEEARRKDEFLAVLAHELRNPLAPIRYAADILRRFESTDPRLTRIRDVLDRQTRHMTRLVDDLLDVSRIARGKFVVKREPLDLRRVVLACVADYEDDLGRAGLAVHTTVPEEPVWVDGDATRLAQALANLLRNACKFTDRGGRVDVSLAEEGELVALGVHDTGIGIAEGALAHVFEPFSQAASPARVSGGLGLGLALVHGVMQLHGGTATARSEGPGRGTEVVLRMPRLEGPPPLQTAARRATTSASATGASRARVVLVEDHEDGLAMMTSMLEAAGYAVVGCARDADEALAAIARERPDGVVCDIGLRGDRSGYDVARVVRAMPALASVKLVALTGYGQSSDRARARAAGFDDHIVKPVDLATLARLFGRAAADA